MDIVSLILVLLLVVLLAAYLHQRDVLTTLRKRLAVCETEQRLAPLHRVGDAVRVWYAGAERTGTVDKVAFSKTYRIRVFTTEGWTTISMDESFIKGA